MMSELTLQQVSYRYPGGSRYALDGISGTFSAGKLYAVIGPSGSGKSTLLSLMAGLDRPTEGSLQLNGSDYRSLNLDRCRRQEIAMIFQAFQLFPLLTVLENVCFPMEAANGNQVMEILLRLAHEEGRCVIVVTHDMDIAAQADEVWRMKDGALALEA